MNLCRQILFVLAVLVHFWTYKVEGNDSHEKRMLIDKLNSLQKMHTISVIREPEMKKSDIGLLNVAELNMKLKRKYERLGCSYMLASNYYLNWMKEICWPNDRNSLGIRIMKDHVERFGTIEIQTAKMITTLMDVNGLNSIFVDTLWVLHVHVEGLTAYIKNLENIEDGAVLWTAHDAVTKILQNTSWSENCYTLFDKTHEEYFDRLRYETKTSNDIESKLKDVEFYKVTWNDQFRHNSNTCNISTNDFELCTLSKLCASDIITDGNVMENLQVKFGMLSQWTVFNETLLSSYNACMSQQIIPLQSKLLLIVQFQYEFVQMLKAIVMTIIWKYSVSMVNNRSSHSKKTCNVRMLDMLKRFNDLLSLHDDDDVQSIILKFSNLITNDKYSNQNVFEEQKNHVVRLLSNILFNYNINLPNETEIPDWNEMKNFALQQNLITENTTIEETPQPVLEAVVFIEYISFIFSDLSFKFIKSFSRVKKSKVLKTLAILEKQY